MSTTTMRQITLMEVGQKEKEVTFNNAVTTLDLIPKYLGDLASDPTTDPTVTGSASLATVPVGSTYFNTTSSKLRVLRAKTPSVVWSNAA